jgi:hypothetical protein
MVFFGLLVIAIWVQVVFIILPVKSFNWIAFLDHDLIYQVERFLVQANFPGIMEINSDIADYGSEFALLTPIFKMTKLVFATDDPVIAYFFLSGVHLLAAAAALALLGSMLFQQCRSWMASVLFLALCLTSNLFFTYMAFLKPDANVVLFCIVASI